MDKRDRLYLFQFLKGAIKRNMDDAEFVQLHWFQFLKGAIKSRFY